jgi:hypothetical protein
MLGRLYVSTCDVSCVRRPDAKWQLRLMPEGSALVMETIHKVDIQRFKRVISCDDTTEECGMNYECFNNTLNYLL